MKYIPHWVIDALLSKKFKCHGCKKVFTSKNMKGMGIRESDIAPSKESFYIQLICNECRKATFFEMEEMDIIQLSENVIKEIDVDLDDLKSMHKKSNELEELDEFNEEDIFKDKRIGGSMPDKEEVDAPRPIKKRESSKITLKDVREAKKVLKPKDLKHESFLEMMGMPPEEIAQYGEIE